MSPACGVEAQDITLYPIDFIFSALPVSLRCPNPEPPKILAAKNDEASLSLLSDILNTASKPLPTAAPQDEPPVVPM